MVAKADPLLPAASRPTGSPEIPQVYLPVAARAGKPAGTYAPRVYGSARIQFADRRRGLEETRRVAFVASINPTGRTLDWDAAKATTLAPEQLLKEPPVEAPYLPLSAAAAQLPVFTRWAKSFDRWIARTQRVELITKQEPAESVSLGPKRGGVSVEFVAIAWELVESA
jgi:hypothetical protein